MQPPALYKTLLKHFGPQHWWPIYSLKQGKGICKPRAKLSNSDLFEIAIGAILTQNNSWLNVEKAIAELKRKRILTPRGILRTPKRRLAKLINASRYPNQKAEYLKIFSSHILRKYKGSMKKMSSRPLAELRRELLALKGIGNETADSIICYSAQKPSFVIDAYTMRFLGRFYGLKELRYVEAKDFFESNLPKDTALFKDFHAQFVELGKRYCRTKPRCGECFLRRECGDCGARAANVRSAQNSK